MALGVLDILKVVKASDLREMFACTTIIEAENTEAEKKGRKRDFPFVMLRSEATLVFLCNRLDLFSK